MKKNIFQNNQLLRHPTTLTQKLRGAHYAILLKSPSPPELAELLAGRGRGIIRLVIAVTWAELEPARYAKSRSHMRVIIVFVNIAGLEHKTEAERFMKLVVCIIYVTIWA